MSGTRRATRVDQQQMSKLVTKDEVVEQVKEMQALFKLRGIAEYCGLSYSTIRRMMEKNRTRYVTVQTAQAIGRMYQAYKEVAVEAEAIRDEVTYFPTRKGAGQS